ncbi:hypothetical protein CPB86DRAFT_408049 [Serendipita vermifera]|nr:hypothetical protein CPB86DRAFT_408049 [Serendipita vermifera]
MIIPRRRSATCAQYHNHFRQPLSSRCARPFGLVSNALLISHSHRQKAPADWMQRRSAPASHYSPIYPMTVCARVGGGLCPKTSQEAPATSDTQCRQLFSKLISLAVINIGGCLTRERVFGGGAYFIGYIHGLHAWPCSQLRPETLLNKNSRTSTFNEHF